MNIQDRLTDFAMLGASWVMWLLIALSIVCLAIILERAYYLFSARDDVQALRYELLKLYDSNDLEGAKKRLASSKSFEAQVIGASVDEISNGAGSLEERLAAETRLVRQRMERNLAFLGTVGNNAPFVGLLGTVIGIIRAFHSLKASHGQVTGDLMSDVGEALVATAIGLLVALPAVASYNFFGRLIRSRLDWSATMGADLLGYAKRTNSKES